MSKGNNMTERYWPFVDPVPEGFTEYVTMENCTFDSCTLNGEPIPDKRVPWLCSCGHASKAEHEAGKESNRGS